MSQAHPITERIKFKQLAAYGSGGIIPIALFNIAGILVGLMGNISLGLSAFWLGLILIIPRLWDAVSDPIVGHLSDNTRSRWGRRRPFILVGGLLVAVCFVLLWWIPKGETIRALFPSDQGYQWFQLGYILFALLLFFTACTIFEIPHGALGMELTNDYHDRTRLFSAKSFVGNLFAMSTPWLFALANMEIFRGVGGNEADGMRYVSIMIAMLLIPLSFWWFFALREPGFARTAKQPKTSFWKDMRHVAKNKNFVWLTLTIFTLAMGFNFVSLLGSYIPIFYIFGGDKVAGAYLLGINGTIWAVTGLLAVFPLNWISPRLGKRNTLLLAIVLMGSAQVAKIFCYNPTYPYLIIIPTILLSAGMLFFFTLGSSMVGDICDEDDLNTGKRTEGSFYSIFWWFIKMGTALASFVTGILIVFTQFDQAQVTKVDAVEGNIREIHEKIERWQQAKANPKTTLTLKMALEMGSEAETTTQEIVRAAEKEQSRSANGEPSDKQQVLAAKIAPLKQLLSSLQSENVALASLDPATDSAQIHRMGANLMHLSLESNLQRAQLNLADLKQHVADRKFSNDKDSTHSGQLLQKANNLSELLDAMGTDWNGNKATSMLKSADTLVGSLKMQSPYTLLLMRIVEIGTPILLSLFSMLFILRYSLTEERMYEIKEQLNARIAK